MSPIARYKRDVAQGIMFEDSAQAEAIVHFQRLYDELLARENAESTRLGRLKRSFGRGAVASVKGLYIFGGVGRGKTYLMDMFFDHAELQRLKKQKNPLESVARVIAAEARVLCFDEFFVSDIGDAMILGGLLAHLLEEGVVLVTTSNIEPGSLYQNGLQRERFLPAIALLKANTQVVHLDAGVDYRLRSLRQARLSYAWVLQAAGFRARQYCGRSARRSARAADFRACAV